MKETIIAATEFKAKCLRLLTDIAEQGNTITITKRGKPIAKVTPVSSVRKPVIGSWKDVVKIKGDIVYFDTNVEWEANR